MNVHIQLVTGQSKSFSLGSIDDSVTFTIKKGKFRISATEKRIIIMWIGDDLSEEIAIIPITPNEVEITTLLCRD